jgi:hypothetical protein
MAAAAEHHSAQPTPHATQQAASLATPQKSDPVATLPVPHAKPAVVAQTTLVTGLHAMTVLQVAVALPLVAQPATTAHLAQTTSVQPVASGLQSVLHVQTTSVQPVANGLQSALHAATMTVQHVASGLLSAQLAATTTVLHVVSGQMTAQRAATMHAQPAMAHVATGISTVLLVQKTALLVVSGQATAQPAMAHVAALVPTAMHVAPTA